MTARSTFDASVATANTAKIATLATAANTQQEAINAVGVNIGANPMLGATDAHIATIKAANVTFQTTAAKAGHDHQVAINNARDTLRATGDVNPV